MARVESEFDVEKDLPEFLSSVLDRTEEYISNNLTNINDLQVQHVVLDKTVNLLSSIAFDIEQDRIEWESLAGMILSRQSPVLTRKPKITQRCTLCPLRNVDNISRNTHDILNALPQN